MITVAAIENAHELPAARVARSASLSKISETPRREEERSEVDTSALCQLRRGPPSENCGSRNMGANTRGACFLRKQRVSAGR